MFDLRADTCLCMRVLEVSYGGNIRNISKIPISQDGGIIWIASFNFTPNLISRNVDARFLRQRYSQMFRAFRFIREHIRETHWYLSPTKLHRNFMNAYFRYFRSTEDCTASFGIPPCTVCARRARSTIPATLIGNWEIVGIRSDDVSQSEDITVIGHLKLPERKVTFLLVWRTFGEMFYVTMRTRCDSSGKVTDSLK